VPSLHDGEQLLAVAQHVRAALTRVESLLIRAMSLADKPTWRAMCL
jgi:hypothetical protein